MAGKKADASGCASAVRVLVHMSVVSLEDGVQEMTLFSLKTARWDDPELEQRLSVWPIARTRLLARPYWDAPRVVVCYVALWCSGCSYDVNRGTRVFEPRPPCFQTSSPFFSALRLLGIFGG